MSSDASPIANLCLGRAAGCIKDKLNFSSVQVWRYYLLSNRPEVSDSDFKWTDMIARLNNELLANLGNFVNRALAFTAKQYFPYPFKCLLDASGPAFKFQGDAKDGFQGIHGGIRKQLMPIALEGFDV